MGYWFALSQAKLDCGREGCLDIGGSALETDGKLSEDPLSRRCEGGLAATAAPTSPEEWGRMSCNRIETELRVCCVIIRVALLQRGLRLAEKRSFGLRVGRGP